MRNELYIASSSELITIRPLMAFWRSERLSRMAPERRLNLRRSGQDGSDLHPHALVTHRSISWPRTTDNELS